MEIAVKQLGFSRDVALDLIRIGEYIKNLNGKYNEAFRMSKDNIFGCILRKDRKISLKVKNVIRTFDFLAAGKVSSKDIQYFARKIERNCVVVLETLRELYADGKEFI